MPLRHSRPAQPRSAVSATSASQGSPAAAVTSIAPSVSRWVMPRRPIRTTRQSTPASAMTRFEPPPIARNGRPRARAQARASSTVASSRGSTKNRAGPPTPSVQCAARSMCSRTENVLTGRHGTGDVLWGGSGQRRPSMRVLLVHPSPLMYSEIYLKLEPLGLERVAAAVRAAGHDVRLLDLQLFAHRDFARELESFAPDAVGFSLNYLANVPEVIDLARQTKRLRPDTFVFAGGHSVSFIAPEVLEHARDGLDCIVRGEGEVI